MASGKLPGQATIMVISQCCQLTLCLMRGLCLLKDQKTSITVCFDVGCRAWWGPAQNLFTNSWAGSGPFIAHWIRKWLKTSAKQIFLTLRSSRGKALFLRFSEFWWMFPVWNKALCFTECVRKFHDTDGLMGACRSPRYSEVFLTQLILTTVKFRHCSYGFRKYLWSLYRWPLFAFITRHEYQVHFPYGTSCWLT